MKKMKVEIWSDVMCPFCYIGKRNFDTALAQFAHRDQIDVSWKSFQLDPSIPEIAEDSCKDYLVKRKGMSPQQVDGMLQQVTSSAKQVGLDYHFDKAIMVNTLKAHQLLQFAKTKHKDHEAEEILFKAYFTEGKNVADTDTLVQLGKDMGLDETETRNVINGESYSKIIAQDIKEAQEIGVSGVPFFVLNNKYAVSGAQPAASFLEAISKSFAEWQEANPKKNLIVTEGSSCSADGICD